ncbi:Hypothetical predicted protein [Lecanosticta acicola]|uniref:Heterokaryon incompatibility domain-containing protein n=1 Tax=Lecanosticta acicola TaxID=111012 RepID=A0AAI9EF13_9PEZI|nr:Hypothetical predicted protein [Lecanosticta acicola]
MQDQADLTDWLRESSAMHKVYGHAFINIAATGASDSSEGLYEDSYIDFSLCEQVYATVPDSSGDSAELKLYTLFDGSFWESQVSSAPLNRRGWVLQERLLAKRAIHFGRKQVLWECCDMDAAEVFPEGLPASMKGMYVTGFKSFDPTVKVPKAFGYRGQRSSANKIWCRIVSTYSHCKLTNPEDKLVAISGIARRMESIIQDKYLAGMWRQTLAGELFWVAHEMGSHHRSSVYRAPTWSWASIDGAIHMEPVPDRGSRYTVKHCHLDYVSSDHTGLLRGGELVLEGIIKRITIQSNLHPPRWVLGVNGHDFSSQFMSSSTFVNDVALDDDEYDFEKDSRDGRLYLMEGSIHLWPFELFNLLLRCEDPMTGTFSRFGVSTHFGFDLEKRGALLARDPEESRLPCVRWDVEEKMHTIRVI